MNRSGNLTAALTIVVVLTAAALAAAPAIGRGTPFFTRGEPREALVVQTIVRGDGFVLPMRNGDELPSKPPLFHWLGAAASMAQGRVTEAAIRLPSLVASMIVLAATAVAAWAWWGPSTGALAAVVLATSFQWVASSVSARVDMVLAAAIALALLLFARAVETGRRIPAAAYVLLVVAALTKGPVGLVLPGAIAVLTLVLRGELRFLGWRDLRLGTLALLAVGAWYAAAWAVGGEAFVAKQILKENVFRVLDAEAVGAGHVEPSWYYLPLLAAGLAPWSLFLPGLAVFTMTREIPPLPARIPSAPIDPAGPGDPGQAAEAGRAGQAVEAVPAPDDRPPLAWHESPRRFDPHTSFCLVWGLVTVALFSVAGSKRAVYLLPAYPAFAMLLASCWTRLFREDPGPAARWTLRAGAVASAFVLLVAAAVVLAGASGAPVESWLQDIVSNADRNNVEPMLAAAREHRVVVLPCALAMLAAAWVTLRSGSRGRWPAVVAATAVATFALTATVSTTLLPAVAAQRSERALMQRVAEVVPADAPLSFYRAFDYGAVFYRAAAIPVRRSLSDVSELDGALLLTWPAFLEDLAGEARRLDTGSEAAGAYEVEEVLTSEDVDPSDRSSLVLVRIVRRIGDERSDGN